MKIVSKQWGYDASFNRHEAFEDDGVTPLHWVWFTESSGKRQPQKGAARLACAIGVMVQRLGYLLLEVAAFLTASADSTESVGSESPLQQ